MSLTDSEDILTEKTNDNFGGAVIKLKSDSKLLINGNGTLLIDGSKCKNGIKGASSTDVVIDDKNLKLNVLANKNGINSDGSITINNGTININVSGDGIKSEPGSDDEVSSGAIIISGGSINVVAQGDAIQGANKIVITDGILNIKTLDGYDSQDFDDERMSCKGLKASSSEREDVQNEILISGGKFFFNCADDAIHSDGNINIKSGIFEISTGMMQFMRILILI